MSEKREHDCENTASRLNHTWMYGPRVDDHGDTTVSKYGSLHHAACTVLASGSH